nr:hypothetical protein [Paraburkholderia steynii]
MQRRIRNPGRDGVAATASSALDRALWDPRAKRLGLSLVTAPGQVRDSMQPVARAGASPSGTPR